MKACVVLVTFLLFLVPVFSRRGGAGPKHMLKKERHMLKKDGHHHAVKDLHHPHGQKSVCATCINFAQQTIQQLLDIIMQGGLVGGCTKLCQALADKIKIPFVKATCTIICTKVGIKEFVKLIEKADLNPFYFCELTHLCPVNDYGDAKITSFTATPESGPQGRFTFNVKFTSKNGTGTGEFLFDIKTVDGVELGGSFLHEAAVPGMYSRPFPLDAIPDPSCDPSKHPCEKWLPGQYDVSLKFCNGVCGSTRPHSATYDTAKTSFTITGNSTVLWPLL